MRFDEQLNQYMREIGCTNQELAQAGKLGTGTVSRYRNGERTPQPDSEQLTKLARGLSLLMEKKFPEEADRERQPRDHEAEILERLRAPLKRHVPEHYDRFLANLNVLLDILEVKRINLARYLHLDPSHVSRILSGKRQSVNVGQFTDDVISYIARHSRSERDLTSLAALYGCSSKELSDPHALRERTMQWLGSGDASTMDDSVQSFLTKLNVFDLNDFMRSIRFEEIDLPATPIPQPTTKYYYGISEMMQAELDFLRAVLSSESMQSVIFYSDMPMEEMSKDQKFQQKWILGMAMLLRKGLQLYNIHDVHRALPEMMLGLEAWIPMYMTGQISPYYLREQTNQTFLHFIRSAGTVAVAGEAVAGRHANGRYFVTKNEEDVRYFRRRAEDLLHRSLPLMHIFRREQAERFHVQLKRLWEKPGDHRFICSAPPLFTMPETLLRGILERNQIPVAEMEKILRFYHTLKEHVEKDAESTWILELPERQENDLENSPVRLALSWLFPGADICYTEEEYREHLKEAEKYAATHPSMTFSVDSYAAFRNIDVIVCRGKYVLISKCNSPTIHFLIYHPKTVRAFESFTPPLCY